MRLLEFTAGMSRAAPRVIVTGRHIGDAQRVQAELLGAIACVTKPICFREISRAIWASGGASGSSGHDAATRLHAAYPAKAHLLDASGRESHIVWNVHDLSASGALLDTRGPLPMHTEMSLALAFDDERIPLQCKVVRIQEPDWYTLPGVAVHFTEISPASRARLESYIRRRSGPS